MDFDDDYEEHDFEELECDDDEMMFSEDIRMELTEQESDDIEHVKNCLARMIHMVCFRAGDMDFSNPDDFFDFRDLLSESVQCVDIQKRVCAWMSGDYE